MLNMKQGNFSNEEIALFFLLNRELEAFYFRTLFVLDLRGGF